MQSHREEQLPQCAYLPFGAGPRACVGRSFAMIEGVLILASILERYNLSLAPGQGEPEAATQISLHPKGGVRLRATERRPPSPPLTANRPSPPDNRAWIDRPLAISALSVTLW